MEVRILADLFYHAEMVEFLKNKGYKIELINAISITTEYHNQVVESKIPLEIAYVDRPDEAIETWNYTNIEMSFGVKKIFEKIMRQTLLNL